MRIEFGDASTLPLPHGATATEGQSVLYGIRPEHCGVNTGQGLSAEVIVVEPTGADTQLYCKYGGQDITATVRDRTDCRPGDKVRLTPDLARAHLFDATSGVRLVA
jgi:multiple sugar transport system ATP-binding protein